MFEKISPPNLDQKNPWEGDLFGRREIAEKFCLLLKTSTNSMVIGVSAPYGYGKTFFLTRLREQIKNEGGWVVHVNAWEYDYLESPLLALLDSLKVAFSELDDRKKTKAALKDLAKAVAPTVAKVAAKRLVGIAVGEQGAEELTKAVEDSTHDATKQILDRFLKDEPAQVTLQELRKKISELVEKNIKEDSPYRTLIIIVDELDRARPNYSVSFIEAIKHLFEVSKVIFVIGCDREIFASSAKHEFGESLPIDGYMRRLFDYWIELPKPGSNKYIVRCISNLRLGEDGIVTDNPDIMTGLTSYLKFFNLGCLGKSVSLRFIEQTICNLNVVLRTMPADHYKQIALIGWLQGLSNADKNIYQRYVHGPNNDERVAEINKFAAQLASDHIYDFHFIIAWTLADIRYKPIDTTRLVHLTGNRGTPEELKRFLDDRIFRVIGERSLAQIFDELLTSAGSIYKP
jgi:hypothetical protein